MNKGFIQLPILIIIIVGTAVVGGIGYVGVSKYQESEKEKKDQQTRQEKLLELTQQQQQELKEARQELESLKENTASTTSTNNNAMLENVAVMEQKIKELEKKSSQTKETIIEKVVEIPTTKEVPQQEKTHQDKNLTAAEITNIIEPSIVLITTEIEGGKATGSGFLFDDTGFVLTNAHVVEDALSVRVEMKKDISREAQIIGKDENLDVALLKFKPSSFLTLKPVVFGDSSALGLHVGDDVYAFGYPLSFEIGTESLTVTRGILSARKTVEGNLYLQTDATTDHGSSGGPLVNKKAEVVGINTYGFTTNVSLVGGYALPTYYIDNALILSLKSGRNVLKGQTFASSNHICGFGYIYDENYNCVEQDNYCMGKYGEYSSYHIPTRQCQCNANYLLYEGQCIHQNYYCPKVAGGTNTYFDPATGQCACKVGSEMNAEGICIFVGGV